MSNLLPLKEIKKVRRLYHERFVVVVLLSLIVLSVVADACLAYLYMTSKKEESALLATQDSYEKLGVGKLKQDLVSTINDLNARLNIFDQKRFTSPIIGSFIDPILKAQINTITLTNFGYVLVPGTNTAAVTISGVSVSREAILSFADNLRNTPGITNVDVPITNFIKESNMPFSITVTVTLT